jgi:ABC-type Fe3+-siderophore transport system permease subunit
MEIWQISIPVIAIAIVAIAAYGTWKILQAKKSGQPLTDERTKRIQGKAALATMMLVFYYLIALNFYNIINTGFLGGVELESMPVINSALIIGGCAFLALGYYFNGKEDA